MDPALRVRGMWDVEILKSCYIECLISLMSVFHKMTKIIIDNFILSIALYISDYLLNPVT